MFVENHLFRKVDNRRVDTSMQTCCRDQRKVGEVIDQIQTLADNLDELCAEINALKNNFARDRDHSSKHCCGETDNARTKIFNKVKKYVRKIGSIDFLKNGEPCTNEKVRYSRTDPPEPSLFPEKFTGKPGNMPQISTKTKHLKDECSQTENSEEDIFALSTVESSINLNYMGNILQHEKSSSDHGSKQYDKTIFPTKHATLLPQSSKISCKLSFRVEDPSDFRDFPKDMEAGLRDKQLATVSTQTKLTKISQKRRSHDFQLEHPQIYFSSITDPVTTTKMMLDPNDSQFKMDEKGKCLKDYPYSRKRIRKEYLTDGKETNGIVETGGHEISEKKHFYDEDIRRLEPIPSINDSGTYQDFSSEEEMEASSSTSISLNLELQVSNSSNQAKDVLPSRKPRTYIIHKRTQKRNENDLLNQVEGNILYVGSTSHFNLSSQSFTN